MLGVHRKSLQESLWELRSAEGLHAGRGGCGVLERVRGCIGGGEGDRARASSSLSDNSESELMEGMSVPFASKREGRRARGRLERRGGRGGVGEWVVDDGEKAGATGCCWADE